MMFTRSLSLFIPALVTLWLAAASLHAQTIAWERTYGGAGLDHGASVIATFDGGFFIGGGSTPAPGDTATGYLVKTDSLGKLEWEMAIGGPNSIIRYVDQLSDWGFIVMGERQSSLEIQPYMARLALNGELVWERDIEIAFDSSHKFLMVDHFVRSSNGGYLIAGLSFLSGVALCKVDGRGNVEWRRGYVGHAFEEDLDAEYVHELVSATRVMRDGGYLLTGSVRTPGRIDPFLLRITREGDSLWWHRYGGEESSDPYKDYGDGIIEMEDGGIMMVGGERSDSATLPLIVTTDSLGIELSRVVHNSGDTGMHVRMQGPEPAMGGGYLVCGERVDQSGSGKGLLFLHVGGEGAIESTREIDPGKQILLSGFEPAREGAYAIVGATFPEGSTPSSDILLMKIILETPSSAPPRQQLPSEMDLSHTPQPTHDR